MRQLRQAYHEFKAIDTEIVVIGPEDPERFKAYWEMEALPFIGLPDPAHRVLKLYGQEVKLFKLGRMPAQVIIDKTGIVCYAHFGHSMSDIPPNAELLKILHNLNKTGKVLPPGDL